MSYKVTNKTEAYLRFKGELFRPKETKILEEKPTSDKFDVEEIEQKKSQKSKGGK